MELRYPNYFPNTVNNPFTKTSEPTHSYNCIAWAFGDMSRFYWPTTHPHHYWPSNIPREESLDAFIKLYSSIGYKCCDNDNLEDGYEKIVIYTNGGIPTHAAKQLENGIWSSKLGPMEDVSHTLDSMANGLYGNVSQFMKRKKYLIKQKTRNTEY